MDAASRPWHHSYAEQLQRALGFPRCNITLAECALTLGTLPLGGQPWLPGTAGGELELCFLGTRAKLHHRLKLGNGGVQHLLLLREDVSGC